MPSGFTNVRFPGLSSNSHDLDTNCYYCTVAALLNKTTSQLMDVTEMMQLRDTGGSIAEVLELFRSAGVYAGADVSTNGGEVYSVLSQLPSGSSVGLAYWRGNGSGHMVVATKDDGFVAGMGGIRIVDYQNRPPRVSGFPPEGGVNIAQYAVFYLL